MKQKDLPPDTHVHTYLCKHASGSPSEYLDFAAGSGIKALGITDHAPAPDGYDPANRMLLEEFRIYQEIIDELKNKKTLPIIYGIEADYYPGSIEFLKPWLDEQKFDLVLGSVHFISDWAFDNPDEINKWDSVDHVGAWKSYFNLVKELADTRVFDALAHLDLPKKFGHRIPDKILKEIAAPALDRIAAASMAIELNTSGLRRPANEIYPSPMLLEMACERGIPIIFGSDSHIPQHIAFEFPKAVQTAYSAGYTHYVVFKDRSPTAFPLPV